MHGYRNAAAPARAHLPFQSVNIPGRPGHNPQMQRHHLLPCQVIAMPAFSGMVKEIGTASFGFHDFRRNGLLLPGSETAAWRLMLPMHRGPHPRYSLLVAERFSQIEAHWRRRRQIDERVALIETLQRIDLLQRALRRRLLDPRRSGAMALNRRDPAIDYSHLDAMVDMLWSDTGM